MFTLLSCRIKLLVFVVLLTASAYAQWATPARASAYFGNTPSIFLMITIIKMEQLTAAQTAAIDLSGRIALCPMTWKAQNSNVNH